MTDVNLTDHMNTVEKRLRTWLNQQPPEARIDALADLRDAIASLTEMEKAVRHDTLVELVDARGVDAVARLLGVIPLRLMRVISQT